MSRTTARPLAAAIVIAFAAACSPPPETPPVDNPPDPQATALRDSIQAPLDKAQQVEATLQDAASSQRARIEHASE